MQQHFNMHTQAYYIYMSMKVYRYIHIHIHTHTVYHVQQDKQSMLQSIHIYTIVSTQYTRYQKVTKEKRNTCMCVLICIYIHMYDIYIYICMYFFYIYRYESPALHIFFKTLKTITSNQHRYNVQCTAIHDKT